MSSKIFDRRGAVDRNVVMIVIAVVILLVAGVVLFTVGGEEKVVLSEAAERQPIEVSCSECGHTWTVPYKEWQTMAKDAVASGTKIMCPQCKETGAWKNPSGMSLPGISEKDQNEAIDFLGGDTVDDGSGTGEEDPYDTGAEEGQPRKQKPVGRPAMGLKKNPANPAATP